MVPGKLGSGMPELLIDAGNTRIKWALVEADAWLCSGVLPVQQAAELSQHLADHCDTFGVGLHDIKQIWVSNVAGEEVAQSIRNISAKRSVKVHFVVAQEEQCGVRNGYLQAAQLGSDRWAALIAAWHLVHGECLVVSCGTATTIDTLSAQGEFSGGLILPGIELMLSSLGATSTRLKMGSGKYLSLPKNSADAMYSGAIQASCGAIQRQHALLSHDAAPVVLSGGAAGLLQEHLLHVTGYGEASRLHPQGVHRSVPGSFASTLPQREEVPGGHSRTRGLRPSVSWPHPGMPLRVEDNLVLQGLLKIAQEASVA